LNLKLLMGNEAIAYGAVEAGVQVATGYPGTPSSEVLSTLARLALEKGFYVEWSINEKAALEVAAGASYAGARAIVTMKQVGLNVAADPLMTLAYIGIKGGLVLVVADDPGPHSSQNEQDTRIFARFAGLPVLDPATPAEAREMAKYAFELSEKLSLPVILRPTTRTCHACQDIELAEVTERPRPASGFEKSPNWVILPGLALRRHAWLNQQQEVARELLEESGFNRLINLEGEHEQAEAGVIACGVSYNYAREALNLSWLKIPVLKIGTPYPLPVRPVLDFLTRVKRVLVVEEQEPAVEDQVIALAWRNKMITGISGKNDRLVPREGELDTDKVKTILGKFLETASAVPEATAGAPELPLRPPVLCAGCPHRASFYAFKEAARGTDAIFSGDIGCYTLGVMAPLNAVDTCLCMGAGISIAAGLHRAEPNRRQVAFVGDSTFFHSGITGLINAVYNRANVTLVVLDNRTTAMTGHQPHPGVGRTATGEQGIPVDIARLVEACGVEFVREVDPYDLEASINAARAAMEYPGPAVVIMKRECIALSKKQKSYLIDHQLCTECGLCLEDPGCPAIGRPEGRPEITQNCYGCGICAQICPSNAIREGAR
jgi:indolepyruvate ferredoxin oxidoreductase alpha subunit